MKIYIKLIIKKMGICDSKNNRTELSNIKEKFQPNQNENKIIIIIKMNEKNLKTNRIQECIIEPSKPFEKVDRLVSNISKSIYKIKNRNINWNYYRNWISFSILDRTRKVLWFSI